jgi:hypothetical protein
VTISKPANDAAAIATERRWKDGRTGPERKTGTAENDAASKELLAVFCPLLGILAMAAVAVVVISGQFPWFLAPLAVFVFFGSCLPWRRFP